MLANKSISMVVGAAVAVVFVFLAPKSWNALSEIQNRQISANLKLVEWKEAYHALLPVNERWNKAFPDGREAKDIVSLYRLIDLERHKLLADVDKVVQSQSSEVLVNDVQVGLQRLCVGSEGNVMKVSAGSIKELREGLRGLAGRHDIDMGEMIFNFDEETSKPLISISGLCLKVRIDGEGEV